MKKILVSLLLGSLFFRPVSASCHEETSSSPSLDVEISALYPNPQSGESEWIELGNLGHELIDLSLYTLEDETAKPWTLSGILEETVTLTGFPFQLNNGNDTVTLKTLEGTVVDSFTYSSSTKGEILTKTIQLSEESEAAAPVAVAETKTPLVTPSLYPIFSEALPNPEGSDSTEEWIELYNPYGETLNLEGLYLDDSDGGSSTFALSGNLAAESYLLIYVEESKITLNNDSDHVRLVGVSGEILWDIPYEGSKEAWSFALFEGFYDWTEEPTPGEENTLLRAEDEEASPESTFEDGDLSDEVEISEVFPNPEGPDTEEEWIELTNGGSEAVNLGNWTIDDGDGGSDPYIFPDDTVIDPGETLIIYRTESEIALNNSNETVILSDFTGEEMDEVTYESSEEDQSYAKIQVEEVESLQASASGLGNTVFSLWQWVSPSPGAHNPVWKQIKGDVLEWDGALLTLFDGVGTWTFKTAAGSTDALLYKAGNTLLVRAEDRDGAYEVRFSELVESVTTEAAKANGFPWSWFLSGLLVLGYASYEIYKKRKQASQPALIIN